MLLVLFAYNVPHFFKNRFKFCETPSILCLYSSYGPHFQAQAQARPTDCVEGLPELAAKGLRARSARRTKTKDRARPGPTLWFATGTRHFFPTYVKFYSTYQSET